MDVPTTIFYPSLFMLQKSAHSSFFSMRDDDDKDDDEESDDACYRTATTSRTSSIACVDVCVEFPMTTKTSKSKKKENSNRACRSQPYDGEEIDSKLHACERACLDAHATSVALKFPLLDDDTREDYGVVAKNECAKRCATSFPKAEEEEEEEEEH
jgi:hypothetical protein